MILILHNIRSAQNVGSIFRTSDAIGMSKLYIVGYTPDPIDRFGRARQDIAKSALGAERSIPWEHRTDILSLIEELKKEKYTVIAIEQDAKALDYKKVQKESFMAFIVGNEVEGLPAEVLSACDLVAEIPMRGSKESLNVSVATGVALFRILDI